MPQLKVRLRGEEILNLKLLEGKTYLAGRKEDCDIQMQADTGISREHFKISFEKNSWTLAVISKFGFVVRSGEKLQTLILDRPILFSVAPYEFEFDLNEQKVVQKNELAIRDQSSEANSVSIMNTDQFDDEKTHIGQAQLLPILKMLDPSGNHIGNVRLDHEEFFLAGREATCQIYIQDQRASRRQFEIHRHGSELTIVDPGSVNGTHLNGQLLIANTPVHLKSGDVIEVLGHTMVFELHDPNFQQIIDQVKSLSVISEPQWLTQGPLEHPVPQNYQPMVYSSAAAQQKFDVRKFNLRDFDYQKHKVRIILGAVAFLVVMMMLLSSGGPSKEEASKAAAIKANDPLAKLSADQKTMVKHHYQLAENYLAQQKWFLAKGELDKVKEILPETYRQYERTKDLENNAEQGLLNEQEIEKLEAQQLQQKVQQEKITAQVAECRKLINPNIGKEQIELCLQPALQLNPEDPQIKQLKSMVDQIVTERLMTTEKRKEADHQAAQLRMLFQKAEREEKAEDYLSAMGTYQAVVKSSLPDRENLKIRSQKQINTIKGQMSSKTLRYIAEADVNVQNQHYKEAILTLRKAKKIDPNNQDLDDKIETYVRELKKQTLVIFQEGILEEGFGNIEGSEGKPGAKDKWKKVLELDVPDGEYYQKARQRLKKYGVM